MALKYILQQLINLKYKIDVRVPNIEKLLNLLRFIKVKRKRLASAGEVKQGNLHNMSLIFQPFLFYIDFENLTT